MAVTAPQVVKEVKGETEVLTAQLQIHAEGPADGNGTVDQPAAYRVMVENRGSADLQERGRPLPVPVGHAADAGDQRRPAVPGQCPVDLQGAEEGRGAGAEPHPDDGQPGARTVHFSARAEKGKEQKDQVKTEFAGVPSLDWDVDAPGVAAVGRPITYRVTVANRGTATGRARLQVDLPPALDRKSTVPAAGEGIGQNAKEVRFPAYDFPAGKKTTFTIVVTAREAGEAKTIFSLFEEGRPEKREDKVTNVTGADPRSPAGPPPAREPDRTKVGSAPRHGMTTSCLPRASAARTPSRRPGRTAGRRRTPVPSLGPAGR